MHHATSRKVVVSCPNDVDFFNWPHPSSCNIALRSTQPLTKMSTTNLPGEVKGGRRVRLTTVPSSVNLFSRENLGASTSHNPMGLHGLLQWSLYLFQVILHYFMMRMVSVGMGLNWFRFHSFLILQVTSLLPTSRCHCLRSTRTCHLHRRQLNSIWTFRLQIVRNRINYSPMMNQWSRLMHIRHGTISKVVRMRKCKYLYLLIMLVFVLLPILYEFDIVR
jgi:hypothetical protein